MPDENIYYCKIMKSDAVDYLLKHDHNAYILMSIIARRARIKPCEMSGLQIGQAMIGDYKEYGFTEQKYRSAKDRISQRYKLATFKGTTKGTIATLTDSRFVSLGATDKATDKTTDKQRTSNGQTTTKKKNISIEDKEDINTSCPELPLGQSAGESEEETPAPPKIMFELQCVGEGPKVFAVTEKDFALFKEAYPSVDIKHQFIRMNTWFYSNPTKRKTHRGMRRFINSWLAREQDRPKTTQSNYNDPTRNAR